MLIISAEQVERALDFPRLVEALRRAFTTAVEIPPRSVFRLSSDAQDRAAFGVLPGWTDEVIGLKAFTYLPANVAQDRRMIHATVLLFDRTTGEPRAVVDGTSITYWRTAAVSALAADYLARPDAATLLVCGTGHLAPYLARAHAAVRPIQSIVVWGRDVAKAQRTRDELAASLPHVAISIAHDLAAAAGAADVITCATASLEPLLRGEWIRAGTHVDLIGNHEPTGRECDSALIERARLFADSRVNVLREAGELLIPIAEGTLTADHLRGELSDLCAGRVAGREAPDQVTCFKSVGMALGDLAAASHVASTLAKR